MHKTQHQQVQLMVPKMVLTARTTADGDIWLDLDATGGQLANRYDSIGNDFDQIATDASVATGGYVMEVKVTEPTGAPLTGTLWFDPDVNELAVYEVVSDSGTQNGKESRRTTRNCTNNRQCRWF